MVNKIRLVQTFLDLVKIDSPSGKEEEIRKYLTSILEGLECRCIVDSYGNLFCKKTGTGDAILLSAHMDTVEPGLGVKSIVEGGVVRSDGTTILGADNKANIAAIVELLRVIQEKMLSHRPLELVLSVEEEPGIIGAKHFDVSQLKAKNGICFDKGDDVGAIVIQAPGCINIDGEFIGKSAHSASDPGKGISAIRMFSEFAQAIKLGQIDKKTTTNIGTVIGGSTRNTIPEKVSFVAEIRSMDAKKLSMIHSKWISKAHEIAKKHGGSFDHVSNDMYSSYKHKKKSVCLKNVISVLERMGISPKLVSSGGASDANAFSEKGIQVVELGYGVKNAHSTNEMVSILDLVMITNILLKLVTSKTRS